MKLFEYLWVHLQSKRICLYVMNIIKTFHVKSKIFLNRFKWLVSTTYLYKLDIERKSTNIYANGLEIFFFTNPKNNKNGPVVDI